MLPGAALPPTLPHLDALPLCPICAPKETQRKEPVLPPTQNPELPDRPRITSGKLVLEADEIEYTPGDEVVLLRGNVQAAYEQTVLTSAEARLDRIKGEAFFREGVRVTDPIGTLTADEVFINSETNTGYAKGVVVDAYEAHFEGEELIIEQNAWRLKNAWATTCREHYRVLLTDIVVRPGRYIAARRSGFQLGRRFVIPVPFFRVGLNPAETGLQAPVPSIDEDFKLGYRWTNVLAIGNSAGLLYDQTGGQNRVPSINAQLSYSFAAPAHRAAALAPRSEDRERFTNSFIDNVVVPDAEQERDRLSERRALAFIGHTTNISTLARPGTPEALDRPWYVGFEAAGSVGGLVGYAQVRYGEAKQRLVGPSTTRAEAYLTGLLPDVVLTPSLSIRLRADAGAYSGPMSSGWIRPMAQVVFSPNEAMQFTGGYFSAVQWGSALFNADRLHSAHAAHFRADFKFPSTDLSLLAKYDFTRHAWYDFEVSIGQAMDCIRPFISYRKFPGSFAAGFTLRADRLFDALKRREQSRENLPR